MQPTPLEQCCTCRAKSAHPAEYCFGYGADELNVWGCRLANMPWAPGAAWFRHGTFRDDETFVFDKHAIGAELSQALQISLDCPHLNTSCVERAFEAMPARASVWGHWALLPASPFDPGARQVAVKRFVHGCPVHSTALASGVQPVGRRKALKVIARALRRCARTDVNIRLLARDEQPEPPRAP